MSSFLFFQTITTHIKELTNEDIDHIKKNYRTSDQQSLLSYVSREYNITLPILQETLFELTPALKYLLRRIDYKYNEQDFEYLLYAIANYIFSTWTVELHNALGNSKILSDDIIDDFGDIELF